MPKRQCIICGLSTSNKLCCSNECRGIHLSRTKSGENNPNFGKKWSDEKRLQQSTIIKNKVDDAYKEKCAKGNKGKKFSAERIEAMHGKRSKESYVRVHSEETKKLIGERSRTRRKSPEFNAKLRLGMEKSGAWIPLNQRSEYSLYFAEADWNEFLFDRVNPTLLEQSGVFNARSNTTGAVRDHAFSRRSGYESKVFPEILRHIENCNVILHSDNVKKNVSKSIPSDSITLEELFNRIENTKHDWHEQELCLKLIKEYRNGNHWRKEA